VFYFVFWPPPPPPPPGARGRGCGLVSPRVLLRSFGYMSCLHESMGWDARAPCRSVLGVLGGFYEKIIANKTLAQRNVTHRHD